MKSTTLRKQERIKGHKKKKEVAQQNTQTKRAHWEITKEYKDIQKRNQPKKTQLKEGGPTK